MRCVTSSGSPEALLVVCLVTMAVECGRSQVCSDPYGAVGTGEEDEEGQDEDLLFPTSDMEDGEGEGAMSPQDEDLTLDVDHALNDRSRNISLEVEAALMKALASKSLTPILKEELRCKIQLKRLQHGQDEMIPDFTKKHSSMSIEEIIKRNRKMEQNRMSAYKSRQKQKNLEKTIQTRLQDLQKQNTWLQEQAKLLRQACQQARQWLNQHETCVHHNSLSVPPCGSSFSLPIVVHTSFHDVRLVPGCGSSAASSCTETASLPARRESI